ncbi:MAG: pentapeptide repeat-containing protein [Candidatus Zixiibacteriota bacterium]
MIFVAGMILVLILWKVPEWQVNSLWGPVSPDRLFELEDKARVTLAQVLGGLAILLGLWATWRRVIAAEEQVRIAREGQITERFTRAIEQLGSDNLAVKLGGIYALERIARDSEKDHWPIMDVLTAYVREHAQLTDVDKAREEDNKKLDRPSWGGAPPPSQDIQAILTVIGRRSLNHDRGGQYRLDFNNVYLPLARFAGNFAVADFRHAYLCAANFRGTDVSNADFTGAWLEDSNFRSARLTSANLRTSLGNVDFRDGADLSQAQGLTKRQLKEAETDETTKLPGHIPD